MTAELPRTPYHIGPQSAAALLGPIVQSLDELERRLEHYHNRLHMPDADRATIKEAWSAIDEALARLRVLS